MHPSPLDPEIRPLDPAAPIAAPSELTSYFAPFLRHFVEETVRTGGEVTGVAGPAGIVGILVRREPERFGSIFARSREAAEALYRTRWNLSVFSEYRLAENALSYPVLALDISGERAGHRYAHAIRSARAQDLSAIVELVRAVYGSADERWLRAPPHPAERCFVAEIDGRLGGAAWVTVVATDARLHSLSVAPRYRRLGVGTDLWHARVLHASAAGARRVVTEIAETNAASRAIASAGGMRRIGQVFEHPSAEVPRA